MLELLQVDAKGVIELRHGAGEHDRVAGRVLVDDGETVLVGELFDSLNVRRVGPELLVVFRRGSDVARICRRRLFCGPFPAAVRAAGAAEPE